MDCYPGIDETPLFTVLRRVMSGRRAETLRNEFGYATGERRWFDLVIDPVPDGICVLSLDVTERLRIELELHHAQRMEALGMLAGGVAHDFNNQLTAILGFAQILIGKTADDATQRDLQAIVAAAERSAALTRQLLTFSRRRSPTVGPTNLNAALTNIGGLLGRVLGEDLTYDLRLSPHPAVILADTQQLENALTNLAVNARDAMTAGGRLTISTRIVELSEEEARQHPAMASGRYAVLSVADTGHGMDEATKARIFEPFFTTKPPGRGTGLGLAMVYGVVKQAGGFVLVDSEPHAGTTFHLYFPTTDEAPRITREPRHGGKRRRNATILVIEDDSGVRDLVSVALSREGYTVHEAATGEQARARMKDMTAPPDLVIADVVLPGESGPDLAHQLGGGIPRLFMSGYPEQQAPMHVPGRLLEKPFTVQDLLAAVTEALADSAAV